MKTSLLSFALLAVVHSFSGHAWALPQLLQSTRASSLFDLIDPSDYQMGSEWGKYAVTEATLAGASQAFRRAAYATAELPIGGTGFYLGKFGDAHVLATNHHVCPTASDCVGSKARFKFLNKSYRMSKLLMTNENIDLTLLEIEVAPADEAALISVGKNFSFRKNLVRGQKLITIGYGVAGNPTGTMMANQDSDCVVFSKTGEYRHLADPDDFNPATYRAWSFSHGCDVSHGDSGSAIVDRKSGEVMGLIWTGRIPKNARVKDSAYLKRLPATHVDIWDQLSYAVPAAKIGESLEEMIHRSSYDARTLTIFSLMLKPASSLH